MNELTIMNISGVDCYEKDGTAYLRLENVARGLGFTQEKNGVEYVRWETIHAYLDDFNFPNKLGKDDYIPENIFYRLAMKAKNETAEAFQAKVADEIIPSIRKHGGYLVGQETMSDEELMAKALEVAHRTLASREQRIQALEEKIESDRPKVLFASAVSASNSRILVGELAKILRQNGIDIGQNRLFRILRNEGYLIKRRGIDYNMPTQKSVDNEWIKYSEHVVEKKDGTTVVYKTPYVTGKGQIYFVEKFLDKKSN